MPSPVSRRAPVLRAQPVARNGRRGARATQVVAFPGRSAPRSAYNLAGVAGLAPGRARRLLRRIAPGSPPCRSCVFDPATLAAALAVSLAALAPSPGLGAERCSSSTTRRVPTTPPTSRRARCTNRRRTGPSRRAALLRPSVALGASAARRSRPTRTTARTPAATRLRRDDQRPAAALQPAEPRRPSRQSERSLASSLADLDAAEQDLILRVSQAYFDVLGAQDTLASHARQQGGDHRAARLGQAQLRGRHRHHHRHPRGAGALRPGDGAGDRGRERPGDQADRARPAGRPAATSRRSRWRCRWCCRRRQTGVEEWVSPCRRRAPGGAARARRLRGRAARDREGARRSASRRSTRSARSATAAALVQPGAYRQQHQRQHRRAAQHAALRRRRDPEPHQGNAGAGRARAQRPRGGAPRRHPGDPPGLSTRCSRARPR